MANSLAARSSRATCAPERPVAEEAQHLHSPRGPAFFPRDRRVGSGRRSVLGPRPSPLRESDAPARRRRDGRLGVKAWVRVVRTRRLGRLPGSRPEQRGNGGFAAFHSILFLYAAQNKLTIV